MPGTFNCSETGKDAGAASAEVPVDPSQLMLFGDPQHPERPVVLNQALSPLMLFGDPQQPQHLLKAFLGTRSWEQAWSRAG
jgi:hypothetical protein